jgi:hypothetical protein
MIKEVTISGMSPKMGRVQECEAITKLMIEAVRRWLRSDVLRIVMNDPTSGKLRKKQSRSWVIW